MILFSHIVSVNPFLVEAGVKKLITSLLFIQVEIDLVGFTDYFLVLTIKTKVERWYDNKSIMWKTEPLIDI